MPRSALNIQVNGNFSPRYTLGSVGERTEIDSGKLLHTVRSFVNPPKLAKEGAVRFNRLAELSQPSSHRLFTVSPDSLKNALRFSSNAAAGEKMYGYESPNGEVSEGTAKTKRLELSTFPNDQESDHSFVEDDEIAGLPQTLPGSTVSNFLHAQSKNFKFSNDRTTYSTRLIYSFTNKIERISFYNALGLLIEKLQPDLKPELFMDLVQPTRDSETEGLLLKFGSNQALREGLASINLGILFVIKSKTNGWEFYQCKPEEFNQLAGELKNRYGTERLSIRLINSVAAVLDKENDKQARLRLFDFDSRQIYQNLDNFIATVQKQEKRTIVRNEPLERKATTRGVILTDSLMERNTPAPPPVSRFAVTHLKRSA